MVYPDTAKWRQTNADLLQLAMELNIDERERALAGAVHDRQWSDQRHAVGQRDWTHR